MTLANFGDSHGLTASPIQVIGPEFLDAEGVEKHFGLKKSILFRLLAERKIRAARGKEMAEIRNY
jgi:hypothetical protein